MKRRGSGEREKEESVLCSFMHEGVKKGVEEKGAVHERSEVVKKGRKGQGRRAGGSSVRVTWWGEKEAVEECV